MKWKKLPVASAAPILGQDFAAMKAEGWETTAADGYRVEVRRVGEGTATVPYLLHIKAHPPEANGPGRWPTLEEIQAAGNHVLPGGTVVQIAPFPTYGQNAAPVGSVGWAGVLVATVGAMQGTPAETRFRLSGGIALAPNNGPTPAGGIIS